MIEVKNIAGVLLAGGLARRMGGGDKCLRPLAGKAILAHVVERVRPQVGPLMLNANGDPARFAKFGLPIAPDVVEGYAGPLAGILTGMEWAAEEAPECAWLASFATDAPFLPEDLVTRMAGAIADEGADMARAASNGRAHPVFALWPVALRAALRQALVNLESVPAPAGEFPVVLGPGWPGILLHEAIGHGLEGDFNRKKTSAFAGLLGERVAADGVTVIDDGTIGARRGSLTIDDEGTPSGTTTLIENGILRGYLHDRMNARLMGMAPTGNGRRESFAHAPLPRMTNTFMLAGERDPEEIIHSVKRGIYARNFGGGQVDITSGKFVFSASEAYLIENGKTTAPLKGVSLIGNGPDVLTKVDAIGNDFALDPGVGTCGKAGQGVPVGVGLPTILVNGITVGGTQT